MQDLRGRVFWTVAADVGLLLAGSTSSGVALRASSSIVNYGQKREKGRARRQVAVDASARRNIELNPLRLEQLYQLENQEGPQWVIEICFPQQRGGKRVLSVKGDVEPSAFIKNTNRLPRPV